MIFRYVQANWDAQQTIAASYGVRDQFRSPRLIGGKVSLWPAVVLGDDDVGGNPMRRAYVKTDLPPGPAWLLVVQNTRNGVSFGASQNYEVFASEEAARARAVKYLREAAKRYGGSISIEHGIQKAPPK